MLHIGSGWPFRPRHLCSTLLLRSHRILHWYRKRKRRRHSLSNSKCNPSRTAPAAAPLNLPVHSTSSALPTVRIWDTFTTLAFGRLASPFFRSTLPGAFALLRFEVIRHTTLVVIALRLKISFWTTTQGRRSAGAERAAGPKSSQYTCPCRISLTNVP